MSDVLIGSIISGVVAVIVAIIANISAHKKDAIANAIRDQKIEDSINELSKRVDAHNGVMDKIGNIEKSIVRIETTIEGFHKK